jgi:hypothetical protein
VTIESYTSPTDNICIINIKHMRKGKTKWLYSKYAMKSEGVTGATGTWVGTSGRLSTSGGWFFFFFFSDLDDFKILMILLN